MTTAAAAQDHPEPGPAGAPIAGVDGDSVLPRPFIKGLRVVGHQSIEGRIGNEQLAWAGHCAYVSNVPFGFAGTRADRRSGVAVINVADPKRPELVGQLRERGALRATETMAAVDNPDRHLLVAGDYAGGNPGFSPNDPPVLNIYDVSDCARPRLLAEFIWPENVHTLTFSPDGRRLYATSLTQRPLGTGGLHVLDLTDPSDPRYKGRFTVTGPDGDTWDFGPHEIAISADEKRIYAGVIAARGGDLNGGQQLQLAKAGGNDTGGIYILDNSDLAQGKPDAKLRLLGTAHRAGWHAVAEASIRGESYLVASGESGDCPAAFPRITSIADETKPRLVGEYRLFANRPENCAAVPKGQVTSSHFNDVDSATDTRLGLFNFESTGGFRVVDLREPATPVEVAYFRPGDNCTGHVRYDHSRDQMWVVCGKTGLWILELDDRLRRQIRGAAHRTPDTAR